ncbi:hypothetical protein EON81_09850 [bacterium]|nr:MAG: hypothetical protein EON81_09850 [bacterium]
MLRYVLMEGMDDTAAQVGKPLPTWLQGTHEELAGIAGTVGCASGLFTVWITALVIGTGILTALLLGLIALAGTFYVVSTRLMEDRWITLGEVADGGKRGSAFVVRYITGAFGKANWRTRPILVPLACLAGVIVLGLFLTRSPGRMNRDYEPGTYLTERRKELDAQDIWPNWTEQKDGKTRTMVLILLKSGQVVQDVVETESKWEGSLIRKTRETLVWSKTVPSQKDIVNFGAENGLFDL